MASAHVPGDLLAGRYRLVREIGAGGMGTVWQAEDRDTGGAVAVKLLKDPEGAEHRRRRFLREARAAAAVRHPNVVTMHDAQIDESGAPILVMELLEGESLGARLEREGRLDLRATATLLLPVVSAVGTAHALGIVHRDLKPENVFIALGETPKVLDFGIAKLTGGAGDVAPSASLTAEGVFLGTPAYMAPEQIFGERDVDHRADVWALGLLLYQCLAGSLPTAGAHVGEILKNLLSATITPLRLKVPELPPDVTALVDGMLARDRRDRPALAEAAAVLARHTASVAPAFGPPAATPPSRDDLGEKGEGAETRDTTNEAQIMGPAGGGRSPLAQSIGADARRPRDRTGTRDSATSAAPARTGDEEVAPRSGPRGRTLAAGATLTALAAIVALGWTAARRHPAPARASILAAHESRLACPQLRARGVEGDAGWLGAAAAHVACNRARWFLGGGLERVIAPADLLDLPRQPAADFPADPFAGGGTRERAVAAAGARAAAWIDGEVTRERDAFRVELTLRTRDSAALEPALGTDARLDRAVAAAVARLAARGDLPRAAIDDDVQQWTGVRDAETGLVLEDMLSSTSTYDVDPTCAELATLRHAVGRPLAIDAPYCDAPDAQAPGLDRSSLPLLAASTLAGAAGLAPEEAKGLVAELAAARAAERSAIGRVVLARAEAAAALPASDRDTARLVLLDALRDAPDAPPVWDALGHASLDASRGTPAWVGFQRALVGWLPSDAAFWATCSSAWTKDMDERVRCGRRAHELAPANSNYTVQLGRALLDSGRTEETRALAAASIAEGPRGAALGQFLLARIDVSETKFGSALERVRGATRGLDTFDSRPWMTSYLVGMVLTLSEILGRGTEVADEWIERFVLSTPSRIERPVVQRGELSILSACVRGSPRVGLRCLDVVERMRQERAFPEWTDDETLFAEGARRALEGDSAGAVRVWRPLASRPTVRQWLLRRVFDETGEWALLEAADRELMGLTWYGGISIALPRAAHIAARRGEKAKAADLARQVLAAWGGADAVIPALDEMRTLAGTHAR